MLPQPFATAAMGQVDGLRVAIDLNDAWTEIEDCDIVTGVVVARTDFVKEHPQAVETFLQSMRLPLLIQMTMQPMRQS